MLRFIGTAATSLVVSVLTIGLFRAATYYSTGEQVNDAVMCVLTLGSQIDQQLTFNITGVVGEKFWDYKYLWIIGEDELFNGTNRAIQCKITEGIMEVTHPMIGTVRSQ